MDLVDRLRRVLDARAYVRLAVVFGSTAAGTPRPGSDVDVGVQLEQGASPDASLAVDLERAVGRRIDLVWLDSAPPLLRFEIARQGLLLVSRDTHAWPEFRARAMIDWWDWAPTARLMHAAMAARLREEAGRGSA